MDITFKGLSCNPNDYTCADGEMAFATNMVADADGLRTAEGYDTVITNGAMEYVKGCFFVHRTEFATIYICKNEKKNGNYLDGTYLTYYDEGNVYNGDILKSTRPEGQQQFKTCIVAISSVGNTLVVSDEEGMHYFLLKSESNYESNVRKHRYYYTYLGTGLPNLDGIRFALEGHFCLSNTVNSVALGESVEFKYDWDGAVFTEFPKTVQQRITESIMANVNKAIKEYGVDKNRFVFPFFVRCAFRLYDDSLAMHTVPIYIETSSEEAVQILATSTPLSPTGRTSVDNIGSVKATFIANDLQYRLNNSLSGWEDIIKSVDIFASAPIYTHEQDGYIEGAYWCNLTKDGVSDTNISSNLYGAKFGLRYKTGEKPGAGVGRFWDRSHCICKVVGDVEIENLDSGVVVDEIASLEPYREFYRPQNPVLYFLNLGAEGGYADTNNVHLRLRVGNRTREEFERLRNSEGTFFLLKSIPLKDVNTTSFKTLELEDKTLENLVNKEQMTGEFRSNDAWQSSRLISYNKRLHMGDISFLPWRGHSPETQCLYADVAFPPTWDWWWTSDKVSYPAGAAVGDQWWHKYNNASSKNYTVKYEVTIEENCTYNLVTSYSKGNVSQRIPYFFYPNPNAKKLRVTIQYTKQDGSTQTNTALFTLEKHPTLYGAFCTDINLYKLVKGNSQEQSLPTESDGLIHYGNYLASSEVNNPFVFHSENVRTVGDGEVVALKSAAAPISQGQYGQYPLYAFTTAGVYAMPIRQDGSLGTEEFLNTDIVSNDKAISYVDRGVIYPTAHGIKAVLGGETTLLSEKLDVPFDVNTITGIPKFRELLRKVIEDSADTFTPINYKEYLNDCSCVYDSGNNRIIFYREDDTVTHLTLNMKSKEWGVCPRFIKRGLNMERPYAVGLNDDIIDYSKINTDTSNRAKGLVISRPMKCGSDDYKKVRKIKALGNFGKDFVLLVLWGSRDLEHWHLIGSSNAHTLRNLGGTSYRYFRVGIIMELAPDEVVTGIRFE